MSRRSIGYLAEVYQQAVQLKKTPLLGRDASPIIETIACNHDVAFEIVAEDLFRIRAMRDNAATLIVNMRAIALILEAMADEHAVIDATMLAALDELSEGASRAFYHCTVDIHQPKKEATT